VSKNAGGAAVAQRVQASDAIRKAKYRESTLVVFRDRNGNLTKEGGGKLILLDLYRLSTYLGVSRGTGPTQLKSDELLAAIKARWTEELLTHRGRIELAPTTTEKGMHNKAWNAN
jgi:hypothetical protein